MLPFDCFGGGLDRGRPQAQSFGWRATAGQGILWSDRVSEHFTGNHHGEGSGKFHAVNQNADLVPIYRMWNHAGRQCQRELAGQIDKLCMSLGGDLNPAADLDHGPCRASATFWSAANSVCRAFASCAACAMASRWPAKR